MGVRKYFSREGKLDILVVHFRLLTMQMQIDVHITLYPCYSIKKMTHVTATVPKMRFVGSNISFQFSHRMFLFTPWFIAISSRCLAAYQPHMSAFNSQMWQNTYCRNFSEPLLLCYCYAIKGNFKTILPQVSQPASAGNVADLVNCKLISHHCMMPEQ